MNHAITYSPAAQARKEAQALRALAQGAPTRTDWRPHLAMLGLMALVWGAIALFVWQVAL